MRSRLFALAFDDPDSDKAKVFKHHLKELIGAEESVRKSCLSELLNFRKALTSHQSDRIIENLANETKEPPYIIEHSLNVLSFFATALLSEKIPENDYEYWAGDLLEQKWLKEEHKAVFQQLINLLVSDLLPVLRVQEDEKVTRLGVLPTFKALGITVEARPIRRNRFRWGDLVEEYTPEITGVSTIASISLGVHEGYPEQFYFQADSNDLDNMISSLQAAKKEMDAFRSYLGLSPECEDQTNA